MILQGHSIQTVAILVTMVGQGMVISAVVKLMSNVAKARALDGAVNIPTLSRTFERRLAWRVRSIRTAAAPERARSPIAVLRQSRGRTLSRTQQGSLRYAACLQVFAAATGMFVTMCISAKWGATDISLPFMLAAVQVVRGHDTMRSRSHAQ